MNICEPAIRRPVGTTLLAIGLLLIGAVAYHFLPVASMPTVDFPTISVSASRPGADPETMAQTVAAPLERRLGEIPGVIEMTSRSSLGLDPHHRAVRPQPQHRRRRARRAGGDQRRAHRPAGRPAVAAVVPQVQSVGDADHDPGADLDHDPAERDVRRRRHRGGAAAVAGRRRRRGRRSTAPSSRRSASASIRSRWRRWACRWRTCAPPSPTPTPPARSAPSTAASAPSPSPPTIRCARRRNTSRW